MPDNKEVFVEPKEYSEPIFVQKQGFETEAAPKIENNIPLEQHEESPQTPFAKRSGNTEQARGTKKERRDKLENAILILTASEGLMKEGNLNPAPKDIAERSGLSIKTVRKYLKGRTS